MASPVSIRCCSACPAALNAAPGASALRAALAESPAPKTQDVAEPKIVEVDSWLKPYASHFAERLRRFYRRKGEIDDFEGGLLKFAEGYKSLGFIEEADAVVYREWIPSAEKVSLIGDFNKWDAASHSMKKDSFGVWSVRVPHVNGKPGIPHGTRLKVHIKVQNSGWVDRVPAWIKFAAPEPGKMGAIYDGIYWNPPAAERHVWRHAKPVVPSALRIYEAHVGMATEERRVGSYREFADDVLPRVKELGYNAVQLMAVMEHAYYASFGYHVTNPFAVSSRSGSPEDLKYLVDTAHRLGLLVFLDVVHSHISKNVEDGLAGFDLGQGVNMNYFDGYHTQWDSRLLNYGGWEAQRYLLSNLRWWVDEYRFDGFRFDGVTSMLYHHHGINFGFTGGYHEYFGPDTNLDAVVYLMLAHEMLRQLDPNLVTIAEDVSGMPGLCRPVAEGGCGFDYRLGMAIPDKWIQLLKHRKDEDWSMGELVSTLCNRRYTERTIAYSESHDQALVGDKTVAMWLMNAELYTGMSALQDPSPVVERGIALHKLIRAVTMAIGGEGWLNFMGNEFGHPEWIDFPREGNNWSYDKCRRQWSIASDSTMRYKFMEGFDRDLMRLDQDYDFISASHQLVSTADESDKIIVAERGPLIFVFNFHPTKSYTNYKVGCDMPGRYRVVLDSDSWHCGGPGRVAHGVDLFTQPEGTWGQPETYFHGRPNSFFVDSPSRTVQAYARVPEPISSGPPGDASVHAPSTPEATTPSFQLADANGVNGIATTASQDAAFGGSTIVAQASPVEAARSPPVVEAARVEVQAAALSAAASMLGSLTEAVDALVARLSSGATEDAGVFDDEDDVDHVEEDEDNVGEEEDEEEDCYSPPLGSLVKGLHQDDQPIEETDEAPLILGAFRLPSGGPAGSRKVPQAPQENNRPVHVVIGADPQNIPQNTIMASAVEVAEVVEVSEPVLEVATEVSTVVVEEARQLHEVSPRPGKATVLPGPDGETVPLRKVGGEAGKAKSVRRKRSGPNLPGKYGF